MSDYILKVEDLRVIYKTDLETVEAVNGIDLKIDAGETLGLVGETGAGKTTTALSIMRLLPAATGRVLNGRITFKGQSLLELDDKGIRDYRGGKMAMVFQDPMTSLNPVMTVGAQIGEAIELHNSKMTKEQIEKLVDNRLEMVGIPASRKWEYPHQFSGGMKQRVVIAMALACDPELIIADEPTTALDVTIQAQVLMMIKELKTKMGTSMLLITHDLGVVAKICDNVAVMYAGEIVEAGTVEDLFRGENHHPYTEGLFGSIPNIRSRAERLTPIKGLMPDPTDLPKGCVFAPRCQYKMDICEREKPINISLDTHIIKCHLFNEEVMAAERAVSYE